MSGFHDGSAGRRSFRRPFLLTNDAVSRWSVGVVIVPPSLRRIFGHRRVEGIGCRRSVRRRSPLLLLLLLLTLLFFAISKKDVPTAAATAADIAAAVVIVVIIDEIVTAYVSNANFRTGSMINGDVLIFASDIKSRSFPVSDGAPAVNNDAAAADASRGADSIAEDAGAAADVTNAAVFGG